MNDPLTGLVPTAPVATAAPEAPAADANTVTFPIPNATDAAGGAVSMAVELNTIPLNIRMDLLRKAIIGYVVNSVNQETIRTNKANAPWAAYDAAQAANPAQTAVPQPTEPRKVADLIAVAQAARTRLYEGKVKKMGEPGKTRTKVDPVTAAITAAVLRDLFDRNKETTPGYKWTDAVKEVGGDGRKYLEAKIAEKVAAGADEAVLRKVLNERYIAPAEMMYGKRDTKATKDVSLL